MLQRLLSVTTLVVWAASARGLRNEPNDDIASLQRFSASRHPPHASIHQNACDAGALCVGPGRLYPIGQAVGAQIYSYFKVPPLPARHNSTTTTYYDYLNIFWRSNPAGGYMNQMVPQLMLGDALAASTNHPDYHPQWIKLDTWHIGAQYFMGLLSSSSPCALNKTSPDVSNECSTWIPKAATGKLIAVEPGEVIETAMELVERSENRSAWILRMGVVGDAARSSTVIADRPFMGLLNSTSSWTEEVYDDVYVGSCLENYGMECSENYPSSWEIRINIVLPAQTRNAWWREWRLEHEPNCDWQPRCQVSSVNGQHWQKAKWKATLSSNDDVTDV